MNRGGRFFLEKGKGSQVMYGRHAGRVHGGLIFTKRLLETNGISLDNSDNCLLIFGGVHSGFPASI